MPTALVGGALRRTAAQAAGGRACTATARKGTQRGFKHGYSKIGHEKTVLKRGRKRGTQKGGLEKGTQIGYSDSGTQEGALKKGYSRRGTQEGVLKKGYLTR